MRLRWLTPVLGGLCLISVFFVGWIDESSYHAITAQQQAQYTRNAVFGCWIGFGVSLAVTILGLWAFAERDDGVFRGRAQGCMGSVLASIASILWLMGALFAPYEF